MLIFHFWLFGPLLVGKWAWPPRALLMIWSLQTQPKSWPPVGTFGPPLSELFYWFSRLFAIFRCIVYRQIVFKSLNLVFCYTSGYCGGHSHTPISKIARPNFWTLVFGPRNNCAKPQGGSPSGFLGMYLLYQNKTVMTISSFNLPVVTV